MIWFLDLDVLGNLYRGLKFPADMHDSENPPQRITVTVTSSMVSRCYGKGDKVCSKGTNPAKASATKSLARLQKVPKTTTVRNKRYKEE